jgi:hypothetical protein
MLKDSPMQDVPHAVDLSIVPEVTAFFEKPTSTVGYVVKDLASRGCAVFDCVLDLDHASGWIGDASAGRIIGFIRARPGPRVAHRGACPRGQLPPAEERGQRFFRVPINAR